MLSQEWRDEAQRRREDLDTGIADIKQSCMKCKKYFNREKFPIAHERLRGSQL